MQYLKRSLRWLPWAALALVIPAFGFMNAPAPQTGPTLYYACYVPDVGAVYRIKEAGLPQTCFDPSHVEFTWGDVPDGAVTEAKIADGAVTYFKIAEGAVLSSRIGANAVGAQHIRRDAVVSDAIAAGAVRTDEIQDGAVTGPKLASPLNADITVGGSLDVMGNAVVEGMLNLGYTMVWEEVLTVTNQVDVKVFCPSGLMPVAPLYRNLDRTMQTLLSMPKYDGAGGWFWHFALDVTGSGFPIRFYVGTVCLRIAPPST